MNPTPRIDRRRLLAASGACLAACSSVRVSPAAEPTALDRLLDAHADSLPERAGAGANHYPMAAEVLETYGFESAIEAAWVTSGESLYGGELGRSGAIRNEADVAGALGRYDRFGDWLDLFRDALRRSPWSAVTATWVPQLAPAISAAAHHGVIRTGHAVRALRRRDTAARRNELAVGLAYWAARYVELPTREARDTDDDLGATLPRLESPWRDDASDVPFHAVVDRMCERPLAPPLRFASGSSTRGRLDEVVREAATGLLEMLVAERHRIWLLHTVTGPAAVEWLLPELDGRDGRRLVAYAHQSVVAMYAAFGEPFEPRRHLREEPADWPARVARAAESRSVHGMKLIDALVRFDRDGDPLWSSVAAQWFEWT